MQTSPSKILFFCCLSFIIGVGCQSFVEIPQALLWGFLVAGTLLTASFFAKKEAAIIGFCLLFLILGIARIQISQFSITNDALKRLNDNPEKITLAGLVVDGPDVRDVSQKIKVRVENTRSIILVTTARFPEYHYLDQVRLTGKLKTPAAFDDFNYQEYLQKDGIYSVMDFPAIELISAGVSENPFQFFYRQMLRFKQALKASINTQFAPPQSSIVEGMLLGGSSGMSQEFKDKFSATGLTHLMAISGSNVVILSNIMISFLLLLGLWRRQALYLSGGFIWLYVLIAGLPASGVRAAIMASIFLLAQALGRGNTVSRVVVLAAAIMLMQNPLSLRYDIGFQLSFLASLGIIYGKPLFDMGMVWFFEKLWPRHWTISATWKKPLLLRLKIVWDIFSVTMAAQLFTIPVIVYSFGNISLVSPLTNLLIIPIVDLIMVFGFLASFIGIFSSVAGVIFSFPAYLLLSYFVLVLNIFSGPWAIVLLHNISWFWLAGYYVGLTMLLNLARKIRLRVLSEYSLF